MQPNGAWWSWSQSNPEWNKSGRCIVGAVSVPKELRIGIRNLEKKFGVPPMDLRYGIYVDGKGSKELTIKKENPFQGGGAGVLEPGK